MTTCRRFNRSIPTALIIPELAYADVADAVSWLCRAFGFTERLRIENHRAQLTFEEGAIVVKDQGFDSDASSARSHSVMVRVTDVDRHYERAKASGARIVNPPTDYPYGEGQYSAEDPGGHRWTFSQTIEDVDPKSWNLGGS